MTIRGARIEAVYTDEASSLSEDSYAEMREYLRNAVYGCYGFLKHLPEKREKITNWREEIEGGN